MLPGRVHHVGLFPVRYLVLLGSGSRELGRLGARVYVLRMVEEGQGALLAVGIEMGLSAEGR